MSISAPPFVFFTLFSFRLHHASVITWIKRLRTYSHRASRSVPRRGTNVPPSQNLAGLHSCCLSPNRARAQFPHLHTSSHCNRTHALPYVFAERSLELQHTGEQHSEHDGRSTHFMAVDSFFSQTAATIVKCLHWL